MISLRYLLPLPIPFLLCACATASGKHAPLDASHPASAQAPEVPIPDPSAVLRAGEGEVFRAQAEPGPAPGSAPLGAYVCPMHADVTADEPGRCSKCGMKLVPRTAQPHGTDQEHNDEEHPHGD